jgi:hypothetical protein
MNFVKLIVIYFIMINEIDNLNLDLIESIMNFQKHFKSKAKSY